MYYYPFNDIRYMSCLPGPRPNPYFEGSTLRLRFRPQQSKEVSSINCVIKKAFRPFTSSVVLLVQLLPTTRLLPSTVCIKLNDRRFGRSDCPYLPYSPDVESHLYDGLASVLRGEKHNLFPRLNGYNGTVMDSESTDPNASEMDPDFWPRWVWEVKKWSSKDFQQVTEVTAYAALRSFQGDCIPKFYGTVRLDISHPDRPPLHPITDYVEGMVLEYIKGPSMDQLRVGVDVSETEAEAVSQRVLDIMRRIRNSNSVIHGDARLANVVLCDHDLHKPVLIDFGIADVRTGETDEAWAKQRISCRDVDLMRSALLDECHDETAHGKWLSRWHAARSPFAQEVYEARIKQSYLTVERFNRTVERLSPRIRDLQFQNIPGTGGEDMIKQVLQWRVREGVRTRKDWDD